jgi:hypothetical protein
VRKPTAQHVELCVQYTGWPEPLWMADTIATKRARAYKVFEHENAAAVCPITAAARQAVLRRGFVRSVATCLRRVRLRADRCPLPVTPTAYAS